MEEKLSIMMNDVIERLDGLEVEDESAGTETEEPE